MHLKRYQECLDWIILRDFGASEVQMNYQFIQRDRKTQLYDLEPGAAHTQKVRGGQGPKNT